MGKVVELVIEDSPTLQFWTPEGKKAFRKAVSAEKKRRGIKGDCESQKWYQELFDEFMAPKYRGVYWDYATMTPDS